MSRYAPILVTGFNRPELLESLLLSLLEKDCTVYVALDVPKEKDAKNIESSKECVSIVERFSGELAGVRIASENLGCFRGITAAVTWGFNLEESLIILEDDIQISDTFLAFATQTLEEFALNTSVGSIAGTNLVPRSHISDLDETIRFSAYTSSWGWATWRDRWDNYLEDLESFPRLQLDFPERFWTFRAKIYWQRIFADTLDGKYDAWDYRWLYSNWKRRRLTLVPNANLVINLGFGEGATHTQDSTLPWWLPRKIDHTFRVIRFPKSLKRDAQADRWTEENHYRTGLMQQLRAKVSNRYPKIATMYRARFRGLH